MKQHGPRDQVALILAVCVLIFYLVGTVGGMVLRYVYPSQSIYNDNSVITNWAEVTKVLIGGLLVYIAGKMNNDGRD